MNEPVYLDLHIHTSDNPDKINDDYNVEELCTSVLEYNKNSLSLISFTDHNTINKKAYEILEKISNENDRIKYILGVELHIRNYDDAKPYHAHMFFNLNNPIDKIDDINSILNKLYPIKLVSNDMNNIPHIDDLIKNFDEYDILLLPHGGQNHSTFDKSIPKGKNFDNTLERTIYYNQFDGFTARTNKGIEDTIKYFKKLNIAEFVNLITGTDNYDLRTYPNPKSNDSATEFIPTWMLAEPTFDGLRISLSESNRLIYSHEKPEIPTQIIKKCFLENDKIYINVNFTAGLNVIIGESSSGKSLLIDSIYRKINNDFSENVYSDFDVEKIEVINPQGFRPHYINQNYIIEKINNKRINEIEIIKSLFPPNSELKKEVEGQLANLKSIISNLVDSIESIENLQNEIRKIPFITNLIYQGNVQNNPIIPFKIPDEVKKSIIPKVKYTNYINMLTEIRNLSIENNFMSDMSKEIELIIKSIMTAYEKGELLTSINTTVDEFVNDCNQEIINKNGEKAQKQQQQNKLVEKINNYINEVQNFEKALNALLTFDYKIETQKKECGGHILSVVNELKITEEKIVESINKYLNLDKQIKNLSELKPPTLFKDNLTKKPKVDSYDDLKNKIYKQISDTNNEQYLIKTSDEKDFDKLSPGWKTAVLLDLVFNSNTDNAPLLVDQPEDNLASSYLNGGLIEAIHKSKKKRQIIIVSHNATIPMLGDAQNVIICKNVDGKITITNAPLESEIENIKVIDSVAKLTDGGKTSIKKRFKKYNLKKYRGE